MKDLPFTQADQLTVWLRRQYDHLAARARRDGQTLDYDLPQLREMVSEATTCSYCHAPLSYAVLQVDHKIPITRNGPHVFANLAPSCQRCNSLKGKLTAEEFAGVRSFLATLHPVARQDVELRLISGGQRYAGKPSRR
jgi:5-methylcytosine-specific restriction endonuclease McrA